MLLRSYIITDATDFYQPADHAGILDAPSKKDNTTPLFPHLRGWRVLHSVGTRLLRRRTDRNSLEVVVHPHRQGTLDDMLHDGGAETKEQVETEKKSRKRRMEYPDNIRS